MSIYKRLNILLPICDSTIDKHKIQKHVIKNDLRGMLSSNFHEPVLGRIDAHCSNPTPIGIRTLFEKGIAKALDEIYQTCILLHLLKGKYTDNT